MPESQRFIRGLRAWVGFRQIGVPYVRPERMFGKTTNSLLRNLGWARRGILSFSYVPLELITFVALGMVLVSGVAIVIEIIVRLVNPHSAPSGFTTLIVLILLIGGVQMLFLGVIGSYLAHIYEEVKRRPPFIVESILNAPNVEASSARESDPAWK
jgi:dolichol-phosphate mannosyltransferase